MPRTGAAPSCPLAALNLSGDVEWVLAARTCPDIPGEPLLLLTPGSYWPVLHPGIFYSVS